MSSKFKLRRIKQCKNCPWRIDSDPLAIEGYVPDMHCNLKTTIAQPGQIQLGRAVNVMACHHSTNKNMQHCIGYLENQLGVGNNIGLRMLMRDCENISQIVTYGEQHQRFEDTLPQ